MKKRKIDRSFLNNRGVNILLSLGIALLICCLRVLTGVHHVRDVVCGFALGFALGCAGMWLL